MKTFLKLSLLFFPLSLLIGVNILYNQNHSDSISFKKNASFFIGSSRVKYEINPNFFKQKSIPIYNLGIPLNTFFNNVMIAEHLIKNAKPKELFIELSPIIYNHINAQKDLGIKTESAFKHLLRYNSLHIKEALNFAEIYLFEKISLKNNFEKLVSSPSNTKNLIGYVNITKNEYFKNDSFLNLNDLVKKYPTDISEYTYYIKYLDQLAQKNNVKIHYFLPLTFKHNEERQIVCTVYQSISDDKKVKYSEDFIKSICHSNYLSNKNHFNYKAAIIMTNYFEKLYF